MSCCMCGRAFPSYCYWFGENHEILVPNKGDIGLCAQVKCLACGVLQCHGNGSARGTCKFCYYGRLPGWSFSHCRSTCEYKGCGKPAVYANLPGSKRNCCAEHGAAIIARKAEKTNGR